MGCASASAATSATALPRCASGWARRGVGARELTRIPELAGCREARRSHEAQPALEVAERGYRRVVRPAFQCGDLAGQIVEVPALCRVQPRVQDLREPRDE